MNKRFILTLPIIILSVAIFVASSFPVPEIALSIVNLSDLLLHFAAYFIYGVFLAVAVETNMRFSSNGKKIAAIAIIGALYGLSDEFHQSFVAGRTADWLDWLADCGGIAVSLAFYKSIQNIVTAIINNDKIVLFNK